MYFRYKNIVSYVYGKDLLPICRLPFHSHIDANESQFINLFLWLMAFTILIIFLTFFLEIIIDAQKVAKIVLRGVIYTSLISSKAIIVQNYGTLTKPGNLHQFNPQSVFRFHILYVLIACEHVCIVLCDYIVCVDCVTTTTIRW